MATVTAEQARQQYVDAMGDELGTIYHALWNEVAWLYTKWEEYVELFGTKASRIELINQAAGHFFRVVQDVLWDDTLIHIARLTDPPKSRGRDNLTIQLLPPLLRDDAVRGAVQARIDSAIAKAAFCRDWRNRRIAHSDLKLALESGAEPLRDASRDLVRAAMESLADVLNEIAGRLMNSTTGFEGAGNIRGARDLLYVLDDGLATERERRERLRTGTYRSEDYRPREL
jgi:hypothetical protein